MFGDWHCDEVYIGDFEWSSTPYTMTNEPVWALAIVLRRLCRNRGKICGSWMLTSNWKAVHAYEVLQIGLWRTCRFRYFRIHRFWGIGSNRASDEVLQLFFRCWRVHFDNEVSLEPLVVYDATEILSFSSEESALFRIQSESKFMESSSSANLESLGVGEVVVDVGGYVCIWCDGGQCND